MSTPGETPMETTIPVSTPTSSSVVLIRSQAPITPASTPNFSGQIRSSSNQQGRVLNVTPSPGSTPIGRTNFATPGTTLGGGGGFVLRGNQLVRLPPRGAVVGESPLAAGGGKASPLKVHLVSASGLVKQQPLGTTNMGGQIRAQNFAGQQYSGGKQIGGVQATGYQDQSMDIKPRLQQYQLVMPTSSPQVVVVNSTGSTTSNQSRVIPAAPGGKDGGSVAYGTIGASATVGEGQQMTALQSMSMAGAPGFKKSRPIGIPGARKPCNCTKSQCLKLYCDCFANGEFCRNCNCNNCHNNLAYENERSKSIKMCLERNPYAFQPKIGKGRQDTDRLHNKGCNCKKSSCLKNYCECYEAKVPCTHRCKCSGCRNTEIDRTHKYRGTGGLQSLANAASLLSSVTQPGEYPTRADSPTTEASCEKPDPKRMPWFYMTDDVVEATSLCLLAKAEQLEKKDDYDEVDCQREILKEFGRCLQQIINSAAD